MLNQLLEDVASRGLAETGCDKAPEGHICDNGQLFSESLRRVVGQCACYPERAAAELKRWKSEEIDRVKKMLLPRVDLTKTEPKPWYPKLPEKGGVWMIGATQSGKTHASGMLLVKHIRSAPRRFYWSWYRIREILTAWRDEYSDDLRRKRDAWALIDNIAYDDLIIIDGIENIGNFSAAREEAMNEFIDRADIRRATLIVSSNIPIEKFANSFPTERSLAERDGVGPMQSRLRALCKEVQT